MNEFVPSRSMAMLGLAWTKRSCSQSFSKRQDNPCGADHGQTLPDQRETPMRRAVPFTDSSKLREGFSILQGSQSIGDAKKTAEMEFIRKPHLTGNFLDLEVGVKEQLQSFLV